MTAQPVEIRIDKYLTAIRIYKTRTIATEALEGGKVKLNGDSVKPAKKVKIGEHYIIKREQQVLEIQVVKIIEKRVSAPLAQECYTIVSDSLLDKPIEKSAFYHSAVVRERGAGRPTKRDRREIEGFLEDEDE